MFLKRWVLIGVLHQQPSSVRAIISNETFPGPSIVRDYRFQSRRVLLIHLLCEVPKRWVFILNRRKASLLVLIGHAQEFLPYGR